MTCFKVAALEAASREIPSIRSLRVAISCSIEFCATNPLTWLAASDAFAPSVAKAYAERLVKDGKTTLSASRVRGSDCEMAQPESGLPLPAIVASAYRPSHPRCLASVGSAVCQMSRDVKWERLGLGYETPSMTARRLASQRDFNPVMTGLNPSFPSRSSTEAAGTPMFLRYVPV